MERKYNSRLSSFSPNSSTPTILCASFQSCCISAIQPKPGYKNIKEKVCWTRLQIFWFSKSHFPFLGRIEWPHLPPAYGEGKSEGPARKYPQVKAAARVLRYPTSKISRPCFLSVSWCASRLNLQTRTYLIHFLDDTICPAENLHSSDVVAGHRIIVHVPSSDGVCVLHHKFLAKGRNLNRKCRKCSKRNCHATVTFFGAAPLPLPKSYGEISTAALAQLSGSEWSLFACQTTELRQKVLPCKFPKLSLFLQPLAAQCEVMARIIEQ